MRFRKLAAAAAAGAMTAGTLAAMAVPATANGVVPGGIQLDCTMDMFGTEHKIAMDSSIALSAVAKGGNVEVTAKLDAIPMKAIPVPLENVPITGTITGTVDSKAATLTGKESVTVPARTDIPTPTMKGAVASAASSVDVTISKVSFLAEHSMMNVLVECAAAPFKATVAVDGAKKPVVKIGSKTKVKVKVNKKKVAAATVTVTGKKAKPTGKVTITVKKGKKTVKKGKVNLKNGKAKLKTKKLKKGKYKVTVSYAGSKTYKSSKKTASFRVK